MHWLWDIIVPPMLVGITAAILVAIITQDATLQPNLSIGTMYVVSLVALWRRLRTL